MESYHYLLSICPTLAERNLPHISKFKISTTSKKEFNTTLDLGGFGVSRYLLEELLFMEAKNKGVVFMLHTKASDINFDFNQQLYDIQTNQGVVSASLVCNASGRKSNFETKEKANQSNETNYVGVKYHIKLDRDPQLIEIHNFSGGYCGISNIEEDKACLCYIVNSEKLKSVGNSIPQLEKLILSKNQNLKNIFDTAEFIFKEPITISGINFRIKMPTTNDTFFIGDSAGSIAPITGNGMSIALRAASVLAKNIDLYFSKKITKQELVTNYSGFWNHEFSVRIKLSRHFQKLSEHPFLTKITIRLFNALPSLASLVIKQTHGKPF